MNELVFKKAQKGDKESIKILIEPIQIKLYKAAYVYVQNESDALDCVHDAIIKAIKNIKTVKKPEYFNTWITRIVINTSKDLLKKRNRTVTLDINDFSDKLSYIDKNLDKNDELVNALKNISDKDREIIILKYIDGESLESISIKKDIPIGTVKSKINRSLKKLRLCIEGSR